MGFFSYSFLHHATISDFILTVQDIAKISSEIEVEDDNFKAVLDRISNIKGKLDQIGQETVEDYRTPEIQELMKKRQVEMRLFLTTVKVLLIQHEDDKELLGKIKTIEKWLRPYKKDFYNPRLLEHTININMLDSQRESLPNVDEYLKDLGLDKQFGYIKKLSDKTRRLSMARDKTKRERKKHTLKWRNEVMDNLRDLFFMMELQMKNEGHEDTHMKQRSIDMQSVIKRGEWIYNIKKGMRKGKKEREMQKEPEQKVIFAPIFTKK